MTRHFLSWFLVLSNLSPLAISNCLSAQEPSPKSTPASTAVDDSAATFTEQERARFDALEKLLTNVKLVGHFTIDGKSMKDLNEETYEIRSAKKLPDGNLWSLVARIKYGKYDLTVPLVLGIEWAAETPVITLDKLTIPGMGTFSARVVFHDNKYAGTWSHDEVGGHLFGRIEAMPESKKDTKEESKAESEKK